MVHGEMNNTKSKRVMNNKSFDNYISIVKNDLKELIFYYPFTKIIIIPTANPSPIKLEIIAVNKEIIDKLLAREEDFVGEYSKRIIVEIPSNYPKEHCIITGGSWIDYNSIDQTDRHFYLRGNKGVEFCVGVPTSIKELKNVLLENVITVDNLLTGYEMLQRKMTDKLEVRAYSHGNEGIEEYNNEKNRKYCGRRTTAGSTRHKRKK